MTIASEELQTLNVAELITVLKKFPAKAKIYISSDSEGNSYGTLDKKWSFQLDGLDNVLCLMQYRDHLQDEDICPLEMEQIDKELRAEGLIK